MAVSIRVLAVALSSLVLTSPARPAAQEQRPDEVAVERFHRVDDRLFRGAQPTEAGLKSLWDAGVRTVISLRDDNDLGFDERKVAKSLGMQWVNVPVKDGSFFTQSRRIPDAAIQAFFDAVDAAAPGPVFVHCRRGTDRTGAIVAFYRIARHGWDGEKAAKEAREVGMRPWYRGLQKQIREFTPQPSQARRTSQSRASPVISRESLGWLPVSFRPAPRA